MMMTREKQTEKLIRCDYELLVWRQPCLEELSLAHGLCFVSI